MARMQLDAGMFNARGWCPIGQRCQSRAGQLKLNPDQLEVDNRNGGVCRRRRQLLGIVSSREEIVVAFDLAVTIVENEKWIYQLLVKSCIATRELKSITRYQLRVIA